MTSASHHVFGLEVLSEIPLPELPPARTGAEPQIRILVGRIGEPDCAPGYSPIGNATLLTVPEVGRYLIRGGTEILVEPAAAASERNVRLYLLGSAFGALLHQRGLLPLHANAIVIGGRVVAFCGHSGAGKSTIAAWFHDRGHPILSDDVCVIGFDPEGRALAYPGIPRLRLWREALEASGRTHGDYARSFDALDKYDVPTAAEEAAEPMELAAIYHLQKSGDEEITAGIQRLTGVKAVDTIVSNTYRGAYLRTIGQTATHLAASVRIARTVPIFLVERLWGFERFDEVAAILDAHAREEAAAGA